MIELTDYMTFTRTKAQVRILQSHLEGGYYRKQNNYRRQREGGIWVGEGREENKGGDQEL